MAMTAFLMSRRMLPDMSSCSFARLKHSLASAVRSVLEIGLSVSRSSTWGNLVFFSAGTAFLAGFIREGLVLVLALAASQSPILSPMLRLSVDTAFGFAVGSVGLLVGGVLIPDIMLEAGVNNQLRS
ncbi:unnamed protein product [Chrysodeixis includens]|uniref:Uncharacterized protein n=1 Tax=Chrysodeixis includens TaxID=689277 RepID=A0A9N8KZP6_CHRIL|nr:unnamed protein product [Chrysodeixis includens]